jgi:NTE family protein
MIVMTITMPELCSTTVRGICEFAVNQVGGRTYRGAMTTSRRVALALGGGGARGYAHIGAIRELERRDYEIVAVSGTSMGAVIGGLYCAGKLDPYTDWVMGLTQRDVIRLLDPSIKAPGLIKAEKVMARVRDLLHGARIEDLPIPFTAVATDLVAQREVWFQDGPVEAALRASIAIPSAIAPVIVDGRLLADGGLLNTLPITPLTSARADLVIAVSLAGPATTPASVPTGRSVSRTEGSAAQIPQGLRTLEVVEMALQSMQRLITSYRIAAYPPDLIIEVPVDAAGTMDFHRAGELIELGQRRAAETLDAGVAS